jgi:DNA-binding SARP family transcriptional activator
MPAEIEFCLLGPLEVRCGGVVAAVRPGRQRAVLAGLLLNAGQIVPVDMLAEVLWGRASPPSARVAVQNYVMRLRRSLGEAGRARISTQPGGYLIRVQADELDLSRFEALLAAARGAAQRGCWQEAATQAGAALSLWRGEPLADVESDMLAQREAPRLAELRLQAVETRIGADLHLGRHAEVVVELQRLADAHPLREHLCALLLLALYRSGRQGEALAAYRQARQVLVGELGIEPGPELRELHQQILAADQALVVAKPAPASAAGSGSNPRSNPRWAVPRELPATVAHFAGREGELAALNRMLDQAGERAPGPVVISAIGGTAGVGKTALAVYWAHQVAGRFPDGQLYVNLHGYDPGEPVSPADVLAGFLHALGVPGPAIPDRMDERAARYRTLLAGRRMLVVLDNARSAEQVRPLLPGTSACMTIVTSRDSLTGLAAREGAARLNLDLLSSAEAISLLRALIGARVDADPGAAAALAAQCSRLPLALRVAAELAAARPAASLAGLVDELADPEQRLDRLDADGDPRTAIRAVFSWSCRYLDAGAFRAFRLAGLHPGSDLDCYAVAALTGTTLRQAGHLLDLLDRAYLIQPTRRGRFGMHDLLRAYASELAAASDTEDERRVALTRLFDYYLHTAVAAMDTLMPAENNPHPGVPSQATPCPTLDGDPAAARDWLEAERASLIAAARHAAAYGWPGHTTRLAATLYRYLDAGGYYPDAIRIHRLACNAAQRTGDRLAEAKAMNHLGIAEFRRGHCQQAISHFNQALALFREAGDQTGQAQALGRLGLVSYQQGRYQQATDYHQQALALCRQAGNHTGETYTRRNLAAVDLRQGRCQQAISQLQQALDLARQTGHRTGEAYALTKLAAVDLRQGRCQQAISQLQQALAMFREATDRLGEAEALNGLGEALRATDQLHDARAHHAAALALASRTGDRYEQARAHHGLAITYHADPAQARSHWQQALARYTAIGAPDAEQIHAQLAAADNHPGSMV